MKYVELKRCFTVFSASQSCMYQLTAGIQYHRKSVTLLDTPPPPSATVAVVLGGGGHLRKYPINLQIQNQASTAISTDPKGDECVD